jgi:hypothetical protein
MIKKRVVLNGVFLIIMISFLIIPYVNAKHIGKCPNDLQVINQNTGECCPLGQIINPESKCVDPKPEIISFEITSAQEFIVRAKGFGTTSIQVPAPGPLYLIMNGFIVGRSVGITSGMRGYSADTDEVSFPITEEMISIIKEGENSLVLLDMRTIYRNPEKNAVRIKFNAKKEENLIELESVDYTNAVIGQSMMDTWEGNLNHYLNIEVRGKDFDDFCSFNDLYINDKFAKTIRTDYGRIYLDLTEELNVKLNEDNILELKEQGGTETLIAHKVLITDKGDGINKFISVIPDYGNVGEEVVIYGDGFDPNKGLIIQQGYGGVTGWRDMKIKTDEYGKFKTSLKIDPPLRGYWSGIVNNFFKGIFKIFTFKKEGRDITVTEERLESALSRMNIRVKSEGIGAGFTLVRDKEERICE